jgi:hypothetical protein
VTDDKEDSMLTKLMKVIAPVALMMISGFAVAQDTAATGPKMVVPEKVKDAGTVPQGEVVEVAFKIVNEGSELLEIKAVRPTCGCTVADYDREIAPGGEGFVKAKLETKEFSGPISKSILIMTNDPREPTVSVVIKTTVQPFIEVLPRPLVRFNAVLREPMTQKVVVVATEADRDFKVSEVTSTVPFLKTSVRQLGGDELIEGKSKSQYEVTVALDDDAPVGPVSAKLVVKTSHPKAREVEVKVYGVIRALIHVTPSQIQFGAVDAKARPGRNVIVVNNRTGGSALKITSATVNDEAFEAEVSTIEEGRRYQVGLNIKADAEPGSRESILTLATTDPDFPELTIPIRATIR